MRGKYSPTVTVAYMKDRSWHNKYKDADAPVYDPDGYDSYGYDVNEVDRAGNNECDYYHNDALDGDWDTSEDYNWNYNSVLEQWGFDGVKPINKKT